MANDLLPAGLLDQLKSFDTPTICNGLEEIFGTSRPLNCTVRPLFCATPALPAIVGFARTATIRARVPSPLSADETINLRLAYYEHIAAMPRPTITVVQDLDEPPALGAWWGEVHTTVHQALGSLGVVTNGAVRDLDMAAPGFHMIAGGTSPSHGFAHVVDIACRVEIHGMIVSPDDIVHADRHGAVVIPHAVAADLPAAVERITLREKLVLEAVRKSGFGVAAIRDALSKGKDIH